MADEQVLPAACLEFLREIKYSTNVKAILEQLQAMARMQEEQSERLDELDGRIANMATYQTVIITLVTPQPNRSKVFELQQSNQGYEESLGA